MRQIAKLTFLLFLFLTVQPVWGTVYDLIASGKIKQATDSLSVLATASSRDGDLLFFQSLVERSADRSARQMEAALKTDVSVQYRQEIHYRLAQYYLLVENYSRLAQVVNDYRAEWEEGRFQTQMFRLALLAEEQSGDHEAALRQTDRYLMRYKSDKAEQWGSIDKSRILLATGKRIGAVKLLRSLSKQKKGPGVSQALFLLSQQAYKSQRFDDAVFYYNILRERYPHAVGLNSLVSLLGQIPDDTRQDSRAEKLTGTYYSVKVGVFANNGNAKRQRDLFKPYGKEVQIKSKTISGRKYHVVYTGHFDSFAKAYEFKVMLEKNHGEAYQVVTR
ncbi:MAG: SPOR domain-containing protein [candidate division Zixibacteria bacterium]